MQIAATLYKTQYASNAHPVLTIDGLSLDVWLNQESSEPEALDLVPAQGWSINEQDLVLAWRRLRPREEDCTTIVPLLICPDDLDFNCTVVVAEQETCGSSVVWRRFGFSLHSLGDQFGSSVRWFDKSPSATFDANQFNCAISELKRLADEEWK
jgi:hypothetical protein